MEQDYLFIGDVHSQDGPLEVALEFALKEELTPVLLGDIFDSRCEYDGTLRVLSLIRDYPRALLLCQSNHQQSLVHALESGETPWECLRRTFNALCPEYNNYVHRWLISLPLGYVLRDTSGTEYRVSHAYFPTDLDANGPVTLNMVSHRQYRDLVHGRSETGRRFLWWLHHEERDWVRVSGHYHFVVEQPNSLVLDGSCGDPGGHLCVYNTRLKKIYGIPNIPERSGICL